MTPFEDLLVVQDHDTTTDRLNHRRASLPERDELARRMDAIAALERETAGVQEQRDEIARNLKRLEDEVASLEARIAEVDRTLYGGTVTAARELQALQDELQSLQRRQRTLEDDELELMERAEPLDAELERLAAERTAADAEAERLTAAVAEAEAGIDAELAEVESQRAEAVANVAEDLLAEYERLRVQLGGVGVARLVNGSCGGCHLALSAVEVDRIRREPPDAMVHCEECGRILVR
ncbi:MAG TPA: C4-type zinc ribbon domain-containing protein [Acidimicrobiales bacterium]|nr:C4-type zinc ribbon domain-containing protein [Acidimicrobiales bacterium]